ncbi:MAG: hypothetical protein ACI8QS_002763 [Planctomycetota bacterium]|jgi:hypothetical protein
MEEVTQHEVVGDIWVTGRVGGAEAGSWGKLWWLALGVVLILVGCVRWRLLDAPLERDEGEYAVFGQFLLEGVPPYEQAVNMKLPGIYVIYAGVLAVFGETARGIHMGLLVSNLLAGFLAALLARRLFRSDGAGLTAAAVFLVFTLGWRLQGPWANAEAFLLPFAFLAGLLLVKALEAERRVALLALTGLTLGLAVLVKQHAVFYCVAAGMTLVGWHLLRKDRSMGSLLREAGVLTGATLVPYVVTVLILMACGVFDRFWEWTWVYARSYTGQYGFGDMTTNLARRGPGILLSTWPLVSLALVGVLTLLVRRQTWRIGLSLLVLCLLSFAAISVGFVYRPHYFQLLAPAVALGCAGLVTLRGTTALRWGLGSLVAVAVCYVPFEERDVLFGITPKELSAGVYPGNAFDGMPDVGRYLADIVPEGERFAVIGSEPELYFYADRRPATSYVYTYALMELQPMARDMHGEMAREIEEHNPDVLVVVHNPMSWLKREGSETYIWTWIELYSKNKFYLDGVLLNRRGKSTFYSGDDIRNLRPPQQEVILEVYRRNEN